MAYTDFVRAGVGLPSVWEGLRGQIYLGSDAFVESMQQRALAYAGLELEIPRVQRRPAGLSLPAAEHGRDEAMALAYASGDYTMQQIASHFEVHYAGAHARSQCWIARPDLGFACARAVLPARVQEFFSIFNALCRCRSDQTKAFGGMLFDAICAVVQIEPMPEFSLGMTHICSLTK